MMIRIAGTEVHLEGSWTSAVIARDIEKLALSLEQLEAGTGRNIRVDCGRVHETDAYGLQILLVWLECVRMRGREPALINVSECLDRTLRQSNVDFHLSEICSGRSQVLQ